MMVAEEEAGVGPGVMEEGSCDAEGADAAARGGGCDDDDSAMMVVMLMVVVAGEQGTGGQNQSNGE